MYGSEAYQRGHTLVKTEELARLRQIEREHRWIGNRWRDTQEAVETHDRLKADGILSAALQEVFGDA